MSTYVGAVTALAEPPSRQAEADHRVSGHIGEIVREHRLGTGMTQGQLAEVCGVHLNTVHKIEAGKGTRMCDNIDMLLAALGMEIAIVPLGTRSRVERWAGTLNHRLDN